MIRNGHAHNKIATTRPPRSKAASAVHNARRAALCDRLREHENYQHYLLRLDSGGYQRPRSWGFSKSEANKLIDELAELGYVRLGVAHGAAYVTVVPDDEEGGA